MLGISLHSVLKNQLYGCEVGGEAKQFASA